MAGAQYAAIGITREEGKKELISAFCRNVTWPQSKCLRKGKSWTIDLLFNQYSFIL